MLTNLLRAILAIGITAIATLMALELAALGVDAPYIVFLFAIIGTLLMSEPGTGLLVVVLSAVETWFFFIPPVWTFELPSWSDAVTLTLFVSVAVASAALFYTLQGRIDELYHDNAALRQQLQRSGR